MGYSVRPLKGNKKRSWKVQFEVYSPKRAARDIPVSEYARLGFRPDMTIEQANGRKDQLNAQDELKRQEARRAGIARRLEEKEKIHLAYLNREDVREFEDSVLFLRGEDPKLRSHWTTAKDAITDLKIEPENWAASVERFYHWFEKKGFSPSYVKKLRRVLNDWGRFYARKYRLPFDPIPAPKGTSARRISKAYFKKTPGGSASAPLSPKDLESAKSSLLPEHYNWLFLSVWFGLRPEEVDNIGKGDNYEVIEESGYKILKVFQTKLTSLPEEECWKFIPCLFPEQLQALDILNSGAVKRPGRKVFLNRFGAKVTAYGGRKNFTDMMLDRGHTLEDISSWLGHRTVERTWRSYKNRNKVRIPKAA